MKKWISISIIFVILIIGFSVFIYLNSLKPVKAAEEKAVYRAISETSLQSVDEFDIYNGTKTYYVIRGKNEKKQSVILWVPEKGTEDIVVKKENEGISEKEALQILNNEKHPQKIMALRLGMENNIPLWEIYYRSNNHSINYYYIDFQSGQWLKEIENL